MARMNNYITKPSLLGFTLPPEGRLNPLAILMPRVPFQIHGLMLWGVEDDTTVDLKIDACPVFLSAVPAQAFTGNLSFEDLAHGIEGLDPLKLKTVPEKVLKHLKTCSSFQNFGSQYVAENSQVQLDFQGTVSSGVFWGVALLDTSVDSR